MSPDDDPFGLQRFVQAQNPVYEQVRAELAAGAKTSHWMWFVFPQLRSLGRSSMAQHFGIASREEAAAYLDHAVLGARLDECSRLVLKAHASTGRDAQQIFGSIDAMKLRSSMTLFARVAGAGSVYREVLEALYGGEGDLLTLERV
jgi:uncharacterized protein (DUF1810 family)